MRKIEALLAVLSLQFVIGCSSDPGFVSKPYYRDDGSLAFAIEEFPSGFQIRPVDAEGKHYREYEIMRVSQCKSAKLYWDGRNSLRFSFEMVEIDYLVNSPLTNGSLTIAVCESGSFACTAVPVLPTDRIIDVPCGI